MSKNGSGRMWDLGAQGGNAKAPARNNAPGRSTARATRAWRKHALLSSRNTVKYRVEEMRLKVPFRKHRAPKMRLVEAQGAITSSKQMLPAHESPEFPIFPPCPTCQTLAVLIITKQNVSQNARSGSPE